MAGAVLATLALAAPAQAAKQCAEPAAAWERATPAEAGMDAAKLQDAIDYGTHAGRASRCACTATAASSARTAPPP